MRKPHQPQVNRTAKEKKISGIEGWIVAYNILKDLKKISKHDYSHKQLYVP